MRVHRTLRSEEAEARDPTVPQVVDEVLTFQELRRLICNGRSHRYRRRRRGSILRRRPWKGLPSVGGLLRTAGIARDPLQPESWCSAPGRDDRGARQSAQDPGTAIARGSHDVPGCYAGPACTCAIRGWPARSAWPTMSTGAGRGGALRASPAEQEVRELGRVLSADDRRLEEPSEAEIKLILLTRTSSPRRRAQLRSVRICHLPGQGHCGVPGHGRGGDVPSLHDRAG